MLFSSLFTEITTPVTSALCRWSKVDSILKPALAQAPFTCMTFLRVSILIFISFKNKVIGNRCLFLKKKLLVVKVNQISNV